MKLYNYTNSTIESFLQHNTTRSQIIYIVVLLAVVVVGAATCFVKVPISVQAQGIIRPLTERTEIKSTLSERIAYLNVTEGQSVQKGDTLLQLYNDKANVAIGELKTEIHKQQQFISDIKLLLAKVDSPNLQTTFYKAQTSAYRRRLNELETQLRTVTKNYERSKMLFDSKTIAPAEMEKNEQEYTSKVSEVELYVSDQRLKWEDELHRYTTSLNELTSRIEQYQKDLLHYTLTSPITGTIEQLTGVYQGSYVMAGTTIAVISPDAAMQVECYVSPQDIGFVKVGDTARIQVSAFPYTDWGMLKATTISISDDYYLVSNTPMFRVRCELERDYLTLNNGFVGKLKKGMTVQARFPIIERTVYQLLFDKVNDWLNPAQQPAYTSTEPASSTNG